MKLTFLLVLWGAIQLSASVYSQNAKLSLDLKNRTVKEVLQTIEEQSDFRFFYNEQFVDLNRKVSVSSVDQNIESILSEVFDGASISFKVMENNLIIITPTEGIQTQQAKTVSGKVTDSSGTPLPGVTVVVKGTTTGIITNADGNYSLSNVPADATLVFSFVGMKAQEIPVAGKTIINVKLEEETIGLEEVVAIGYGVQKKETLTGSIASVKGMEISAAPVTNISQSIQGRLPGVIAVTRSGEPGRDGTTIRVRGTNTLGNNSALIVVDGIPGRSLDRIDPNSIETITVLKDASAAIYGSQAANGVILITTKRGQAGKPTIVVNYDQGVNQPTRIPKLLNAAEYATAINEINEYRGLPDKYSSEDIRKYMDGSSPWTHPNTDWFAETFKEWSSQKNANISASGGSEFMRYFVSIGAKNQGAYYKNSGTYYNQYDFRSNLDIDVNKNIKLGFDVVGRMEDRNYPNGNNGTSDIFRMIQRGKPNEPAYWPNGLPAPDIEFGSNPVVITTNLTGYDRDKDYIMNSNFSLDINIPWIKGLSLSGNASIDKTFSFQKSWQKPWYLYSWDYQSYDENGEPILIAAKKGVNDARLTERMEDAQSILLNGIINYQKTFKENHHVGFMAGIETRKGKGDWFSAYRRYFESTALEELNAGGAQDMNNGGSAYQNARLNYFGRINYNFMEKYLAEFVWRVDGSYIFPENGRYGFFPGISLGWRISEEAFWKETFPIINNFKLRASFGQTGNDRIDEWQYLTSYAFAAQTQNQIFNGQENRSLYETRIPNPNITWEVANQGDVGFDASFLQDKLSFNFDYFDYRRSNILWKRNASIPKSTGLSLPRENIGEVTNRGFDFDLKYRDQKGDVKYQISLNAGYAKNKITFWDEAPGAPEYQRSTGKPIPSSPDNVGNDLYYQAIGIFKDQAAVDAYPHWPGARPGDIIFKDVNDDKKIDSNDRVRSDKTNMPTLQAGLGINIEFRQFYLNTLFQGSAGAVRHIILESGEIGNYLKSDFGGRWTEANTDAQKPRLYNRNDQYWSSNRNTYYLHKTDYIRLKNLELGYIVPSAITSSLKLQEIRIYLSGFNLFTYSPDLKDFDPEDNSEPTINYPLSRIINLGLSVTF